MVLINLSFDFTIVECDYATSAFQNGDQILVRKGLDARLRWRQKVPIVLEDGTALSDWDLQLYMDSYKRTAAEVDASLTPTDTGMLRYVEREPRRDPRITIAAAWLDDSLAEVASSGREVRISFSARKIFLQHLHAAPKRVLRPGDTVPLNGISVSRSLSLEKN